MCSYSSWGRPFKGGACKGSAALLPSRKPQCLVLFSGKTEKRLPVSLPNTVTFWRNSSSICVQNTCTSTLSCFSSNMQIWLTGRFHLTVVLTIDKDKRKIKFNLLTKIKLTLRYLQRPNSYCAVLCPCCLLFYSWLVLLRLVHAAVESFGNAVVLTCEWCDVFFLFCLV